MRVRHHYTSPVSSLSRSDCEIIAALALDEDAPGGDPTSESIFAGNDTGSGVIVSREAGVLCGIPVVLTLADVYAERVGSRISAEPRRADGDAFGPGDEILLLTGRIGDLLRLERPILNFLQYLSGIASVTAAAVAKAPEGIEILDTRKTLPGYRRLAKYAVYCGGGTNHRIHLSEMAMVKDNHVLAAGGVRRAADAVRSRFPALPLEIEVDRLDQLEEALSVRPRVILLDNMNRSRIEEACKTIRRLPESERPLIEVSGGWKPDQLHELAGLGPLGVSMGFLTHTTRFLDLSLEMKSGKGSS